MVAFTESGERKEINKTFHVNFFSKLFVKCFGFIFTLPNDGN